MTPRPAQPPEQAEAKKFAIIQATLDAIVARGPSAFRMADVAKAVCLSVGTVQYYFGSRDALLAEAFSAHSAKVLNDIEKLSHPGEPATAGSALRQLTASLAAISEVGHHQQRSEIWIELVIAARRSPVLQGCVDEVFNGWQRHFTSIIELGVANREFVLDELSVSEVVDAIIALIDGFDLAAVTGRGKDAQALTEILSRTVAGIVDSQ